MRKHKYPDSAVRQKSLIKERIRLSNEREKAGLSPDEWVVEFRRKNNAIKSAWKAKKPAVIPKPKLANSGSFKKGQASPNKKTEEHRNKSKARWKIATKEWHKNNKDRINESRRLRRSKDPAFKIAGNLRKRLSTLVRKHSTKKNSSNYGVIGL